MFLMRPYFPPRHSLRLTSCAVVLVATLLGTMLASQAPAANSDVIVQPLGTSHGNSDVLVMPNPNVLPTHSHEPEEVPLPPDPPPTGSEQNFSSLIDILQNKPKAEVPAPEVAEPAPPPQATPILDPPEPRTATIPQIHPADSVPQPRSETPRAPLISPHDLLPVPYNSHDSGPK